MSCSWHGIYLSVTVSERPQGPDEWVSMGHHDHCCVAERLGDVPALFPLSSLKLYLSVGISVIVLRRSHGSISGWLISFTNLNIMSRPCVLLVFICLFIFPFRPQLAN